MTSKKPGKDTKPRRKAYPTVIQRADSNNIVVDGIEYVAKAYVTQKIGKVRHMGDIEYMPLAASDVPATRILVKRRLLSAISRRDVLEEAVNRMPVRELRRLARLLQKPAVKIEKQKGCLGLQVSTRRKGEWTYLPILP